MFFDFFSEYKSERAYYTIYGFILDVSLYNVIEMLVLIRNGDLRNRGNDFQLESLSSLEDLFNFATYEFYTLSDEEGVRHKEVLTKIENTIREHDKLINSSRESDETPQMITNFLNILERFKDELKELIMDEDYLDNFMERYEE